MIQKLEKGNEEYLHPERAVVHIDTPYAAVARSTYWTYKALFIRSRVDLVKAWLFLLHS